MLKSRKAAGFGLSAVVVLAVAMIFVLRDDQGPHTIKTADGVILVAGSTDEGMEAAFESSLAFTAEGCLGLAAPKQSVASVVAVFPAGTKVVDSSPLTIRINGQDIKLGQVFTGSGGEVEAPKHNDLIPAGPKKCLTRAVFLMSPE